MPSPGPNTFLTPDIIAREALLLLQSNLVAARLFTRKYEADLAPGLKVGDTVRIRRREKGAVTEFTEPATITPGTRHESSVNLQLEKHFDSTRTLSAAEQTLDIISFSEQVLNPEIVEIAEQVDLYALTKLHDIPNPSDTTVFNHDASAGAPVLDAAIDALALPSSIATLAEARQTANELKIPTRPRFQIASPEYERTLLSAPEFTKVNESGADGALRDADLGVLLGMATFMDQNVDSSTHTSGGQLGAQIAGALSIGDTSIVYDNGTISVNIEADDLVKIDGYGFVVAAAQSVADGSGNGTLTIKEPLREDVADDVFFSVVSGTTGLKTYERHGALFHPECLAFVAAPLEAPMGARSATATDETTNLSIRVVMDYDILTKRDIVSLDVLVGALMVDGRLGAQILKA